MNALVYIGLMVAMAAAALNVAAGLGIFLFATLQVVLLLSLVGLVGCVAALGGVALHESAKRKEAA